MQHQLSLLDVRKVVKFSFKTHKPTSFDAAVKGIKIYIFQNKVCIMMERLHKNKWTLFMRRPHS